MNINTNLIVAHNKMSISNIDKKLNKNNFQKGTFNEILNVQVNLNKNNIKFSKHASLRLKSRDIKFTNEQLNKINSSIIQAEKKGIKDSLIIIDNVSLVVNVNSKTVITAIDNDTNKEKIFTNIDGAILI